MGGLEMYAARSIAVGTGPHSALRAPGVGALLLAVVLATAPGCDGDGAKNPDGAGDSLADASGDAGADTTASDGAETPGPDAAPDVDLDTSLPDAPEDVP